MMQLGAEAVFVGSGIFKSDDPAARARAIVQAATHYNDPEVLAEVSRISAKRCPGSRRPSSRRRSCCRPAAGRSGWTRRASHSLPAGLPVPVDDGAADHLPGTVLPAVALPSTAGGTSRLDRATAGRAVLFFYPRTGEAGKSAGPQWGAIAGARGCTPQSCGFRDLHRDFEALGVRVLGVSTQTTAYQREAVERLHLPFEILSDADLVLTRALRLPTFEYPVPSGGGNTLIKRMAWYVESGRIEKVWYPVFPPDRNADLVLEWLGERARLIRAPDKEVRSA